MSEGAFNCRIRYSNVSLTLLSVLEKHKEVFDDKLGKFEHC